MKSLKKWNWNAFTFVFLLSALGLGTNKSLHNITDWAIMTAIVSIPLGLIVAWMSQEE